MNLSDITTALSQIVVQHRPDFEQWCARLTQLCKHFLERFDDGPVSLLRAPARINVLGEHIDYVSYLPTASLTFGSRERDALMLYRKSAEPLIRGDSSSPNYGPSCFDLLKVNGIASSDNIEAEWLSILSGLGTPEPHWQNYIKGAAAFARAKFGTQISRGFDFEVDSNIPPGGGASSSSALVVLGGAAIREVNNVAFTANELAQDSALAEWYIGTRGGSMDHTTICLAQPGSAVLINYSNRQTRRVSLPDQPFQWVTFFTQPADKGREVMIEYNERAAVSRLLIPAVIEAWKSNQVDLHARWSDAVNGLVDESGGGFEAVEHLLLNLPETLSIERLKSDYPETFSLLGQSFPALLSEPTRWPVKLRTRALHHLGEVKRVAIATRHLDSIETGSTESKLSAMRAIGKLLYESHESLRDLYDVSTNEVERLLGIIRPNPHVLGARLMGGGFGGNVLALTSKNHSKELIELVQKQYYDEQNRDGIAEGSIMISTPGQGLAHVDLNETWREGIASVNSMGAAASGHSGNLRLLIDALPLKFNPAEIWPVIVAAGKGTRAIASGLEVPKPAVLVGDRPAIVHVLQSIRHGLGKTRPPVIIVSPETEASISDAVAGEDVTLVMQREPLGTGDAVFKAYELMHDFAGLTLVVWSTQPVIRAQTFERTGKLATLFSHYEMVLPTTFRERPYAPLQRTEQGEVRSASETHLEGAPSIDFGETNIGLFLLKNKTMFEVLQALRRSHWCASTGSYNRNRGELGFPNEVINLLALREFGVFASPIADWREEQGIKKLQDVETCKRFIFQLEQESAPNSGNSIVRQSP
jgi:galactokinase